MGQQSVVKTLVNAIKLNRTHQAYVFSGSRGIGKTSIARIFSKALRCSNVKEVNGLLVSCDECSDCKEIMLGTSMNVLEIDGASNNGVDSIREIRENVKFLPSTGKYKIYIIDEVHMLSNQAFNALLKTLEEPPEHVVFIFATTEAHKIPETILGRCQRFDFKRVTPTQIVDHLKEVLKSEKIEFEESALHLISRSAEGSMRDALSILDQVISFSGMKVTAQAVRESVGLIGFELVAQIFEMVQARNAKKALELAQGAFHQGIDLKLLLKALIEMTHATLTIQATQYKRTEDLQPYLGHAYAAHEIEKLIEVSRLRLIEENELIFQVFHHGLDLLSGSGQPKLVFDVLLMKCALAERLVPTEEYTGEQASEAPEATVESSIKPTIKAQTQLAPTPSEPSAAAEASGPAISWEGFLETAFQKKPMIAVIFETAIDWKLPVGNIATLQVTFKETDKAKALPLTQKPFKEQVQQLVDQYFNKSVSFEILYSTENKENVLEKEARIQKESKEKKMQSILNNEIVQEARAVFGAELSNIEIIDGES